MKHRLVGPTVYVLSLAACISCSPSSRIADSAVVARTNAESSRGRFVWIGENAGDTTGVQAQAAEGVKEQDSIIDAADGIVRALPGIKDATPWWATALLWGLIALSVIGAVALLWMTGIGAFVRQLLASVAGLIPRRQRREADLAVKVMDEASPEGIREYIAARRASDPVFDAAYSKALKERYGQSAGHNAEHRA